jgi:hypothetical protein
MVLPDILKNAPFFKKIETKQQKQAMAKQGKAKQAAQQRATGEPFARHRRTERSTSPTQYLGPLFTCALVQFAGRRDVGLPEKQKQRDAKKNPNFS